MTILPDEDVGMDVLADHMDPDAAACPACGGAVALDDDLVVGEILYCEHCGAELELISIDPPRLELFEEEEK